MFEKTVSPENIENIQNKSGKHELKKIDGSSNVDLTFFMEQEEDLYATLNDHDSISSENINSFNKTTYMRNDEVINVQSLIIQKSLTFYHFFRLIFHFFRLLQAVHIIPIYRIILRSPTKTSKHLTWKELILTLTACQL